MARKLPNAETKTALAEAEAGNLPSFASVEELMVDLNAPDEGPCTECMQTGGVQVDGCLVGPIEAG